MKNSNTIPDVICKCGKGFTKKGFIRHKCEFKKPTQIFKCDFCNKEFLSEKVFFNHICDKKRRFLQKDDKANKIGFIAYDYFNRKNMGQTSTTYEKFSNSRLYNAFVKFGKYVIDLNALNPIGFIEFLIRIEAPIDKWTQINLYTTYVHELNKNESALDALERNFMLMQHWAIESGENWCDFFRKIATPLAALWISTGRISPWILFTATSAKDLLTRMTSEQLSMVEKTINPEFWQLKITKHQQEVDIIRETLAENGI
jgi:hypothetical protein